MTHRHPGLSTGLALSLGLLLCGCASDKPLPTAGLDKDMQLQAGDDPGLLIYRSPGVAASAYHGYLVEAATIDSGADADFGDVSAEDQRALAAQLSKDFSTALARHYTIAQHPGAGIARLQLTLVGIAESHPVASTLSRLNPVGLALTAVKSAADQPAAFTGSVTIAGEFTDSLSGKVLGGFVDKASPAAYDLSSGLGKLRAAQLGVSRAAGDFEKGLVSLQEKVPKDRNPAY